MLRRQDKIVLHTPRRKNVVRIMGHHADPQYYQCIGTALIVLAVILLVAAGLQVADVSDWVVPGDWLRTTKNALFKAAVPLLASIILGIWGFYKLRHAKELAGQQQAEKEALLPQQREEGRALTTALDVSSGGDRG